MSSRLGIAGIVLLAAFGLAACGGGGGSGTAEAPPPPEPTPQETCVADGGRWNADMTCTSAAALLAERQAGQRSAILTAINAATMALSVVTAAGDGATEAEVMPAEAAVARARAAIAAANDLPADEIAQHNNALGQIDTPLMTARTELDERQRVADVDAARTAASQSYMDADSYATKAEAAADAAEDTAPDSPGAMAAREAATAARMAADAAKMAHGAITDDMTKAEADEQKDKAAAEVVKAMSQYMMAKRENDTIQTAASTGEEQQRMRDVAAASDAAGMAAMAAMTAKNAADTAATAAETARDAARDAYMHAVRARTDSATARAEYENAMAAAMEARTAADNANTAYMDAMSAADGIDDDGTADAAEMAQMTAEEEQEKAETARDTAISQQSMAETAQSAAEEARDTHVIALLIRANGQNITEPVIDNSSAPEDESMTVEELREAAAKRAAMEIVTAITRTENDNGSAGTTATATWPGVVDDPDTDANESATSVLSIMVDPEISGAPMTFRTVAVEADPDATPPVEAAPQTAGGLAEGGLTGFPHGFSISDGVRHAIVFTDKTQDDAPVAASAAVTFRYVEDEAVTTVAELALGDDKTGPTYTGVTWTPSGEEPLTGTLSCPEGTTNCDIQIDADGAITEIAGYVFTGSREARAAVTAMDAAAQAAANQDYLAFGVWLHEDGDGNGTADDPQFGAFAAGGSAVTTTTYGGAEVTGQAQYNGSATGVYTEGSSVDYFQGDATLTAKFGDATALGTITGEINNIYAGGNRMDDTILLNDDGTPAEGNIAADGTFSGDARMGFKETVDAVTTYHHNGSWSGRFYNGTADDPDTATVNESHVAPGSVAGTFGVTGTTGTGDAAVTRSYVGAFGAHKQ